MAALMPYQKPLLDAVLLKAGGHEEEVANAVRATLDEKRQEWRGVNYGFIYRTLCDRAKARIAAAKKRAAAGKRPKLTLTP